MTRHLLHLVLLLPTILHSLSASEEANLRLPHFLIPADHPVADTANVLSTQDEETIATLRDTLFEVGIDFQVTTLENCPVKLQTVAAAYATRLESSPYFLVVVYLTKPEPLIEIAFGGERLTGKDYFILGNASERVKSLVAKTPHHSERVRLSLREMLGALEETARANPQIQPKSVPKERYSFNWQIVKIALLLITASILFLWLFSIYRKFIRSKPRFFPEGSPTNRLGAPIGGGNSHSISYRR